MRAWFLSGEIEQTSLWLSFAVTLVVAFIAFAIFALILAVPLFRKRKIKRRCACAASKEVLRVLEERERAAKLAREYRPENVDVNDLPQASPELAEFARGVKRFHFDDKERQ